MQTQAGTSADEEGHFNLINVSPGKYSVRVMMIGYESLTIEDVVVSVNRTTSLDLELKQSVIEGQEVVISQETSVHIQPRFYTNTPGETYTGTTQTSFVHNFSTGDSFTVYTDFADIPENFSKSLNYNSSVAQWQAQYPGTEAQLFYKFKNIATINPLVFTS